MNMQFYKFEVTVPEEELGKVLEAIASSVGYIAKVSEIRVNEILSKLSECGVGLKFGYLDVIPLMFTMPKYLQYKLKEPNTPIESTSNLHELKIATVEPLPKLWEEVKSKSTADSKSNKEEEEKNT